VTIGPSEGVPTRDGHPDAATIAAHVERRLTRVEAARLEEHLAGCSTCYELFAETVRFRLEEEADEDVAPTVVVIPLRRRPAARVAAALAVAAGLALASWPLWRAVVRPAAPPILADLVRSVGDQRLIEPRLTGGFRYARFVRPRSGDAPQGLDAQPPAVIAAVARIRERAETDTSPEALSALGITYLVSGDAAAAVKALESAAAQAPQDPRIQSDLAAAYLTRASRLDEPIDLPRALEAAEKAAALPGAPEEAWFNRALALEGLQLADEARKAWDDYLKRDPRSPWADEARRRLADLPPPRRSSVEEDRARARQALAEGASSLERLTEEEPSIVRAYFDEELLPAWAEARLAPVGDARPLAEQAALVGGALWRRTGDALPRDAAAALPSSVALAGRDPPREPALGYRLLAEARRRDETQSGGCESFREAHRILSRVESPYAAVAAERVVAKCFYPGQLDAARAALARIDSAAEPRAYHLLVARTRRLQGLIAVMQGNLTGALDRYRLARDGFAALGDRQDQAFVHALRAEAFTLLGDGRQAWEERRSALALLDRVQDPRRVQSILEEAALACLDARLPRAALAVLTALVESGRLNARPALLSDTLTRRGAVRHALGQDRLAELDLADARRLLPRIEDRALSDRMRAEVDAAEGVLLTSTQPERAVDALRRAAAYFARAGPVRVPPLRLQTARAQSTRGLVDAAEEELLAGIHLIEAQRVSLHDLALQASFFEQAVPLYDDMVALQLDQRHDPAAALAFVERARARQLVDSLAAEATRERPGMPDVSEASFAPSTWQPELPHGVALVYYASLGHRLLAWLVTRDDLRFVEQAIPQAEIVRLVAAQQAALERRATLAAVQRVGARLHDVLVRPLAPLPASVRALAFVPDAALHSASFAALWDRGEGRYLAEAYVLGVSPSGRLLTRHSGDPALPASPHALVVGDPRVDSARWSGFPPLPAAEQEAAGVAALYTGAELLVGGAATKAAFLEALRRSDVVHYAGHATSVADDPARSRLLLAPDAGDSGALSLRDLPFRDLRAGLVVLAACRSAAGPVSRTEGAFSLGRPFMAAGVPNVVGSLWDVDDDVSRTFFVAFHRSLLAGADPARALQSTQLSLLRSGDPTLAHPSTWAGFVSIGALRTPPR
jgi:CHAT domain-containing protein